MLKFLVDLLSQASVLIALVTMVGLLLQRSPLNEVISGTMKSFIGFIILGAGAGVIVTALEPFGAMFQEGFKVQGVVPNNEAIVAMALQKYGTQTSLVMIGAFFVHLLIARLTPLKYIFLTGHHIFYMACMITAILATGGLEGIKLISVGAVATALVMSISPMLTKWAMPDIVGKGTNISLGHFSNITYATSALIGKYLGNRGRSTEDIKMTTKLAFLRDNILVIALTMSVFYIIVAVVAGREFVETKFSGGQNYIVYALIQAATFAAGVSIVLSGVRMIIGEIVPAFSGISRKLVPNSSPALDCPIIFPYAPNAVIIGFLVSFAGGIAGLFALRALGGPLILPGVVPHFFVGATAGVFGNSTGGMRGCILGSFVNGLLLAFLPVVLLPVLGDFGFANTTFSDGDFVGAGWAIGEILKFAK